MNRTKVLIIVLFLPVYSSHAAIHWVGDPGLCTVSNSHATLGLALFAAALSPEDDEIRLSDTVSYFGSGNSYTLTDWDPDTTGTLKITGGFANCFNAPGGPTFIGGAPGDVFTVRTSSQDSSVVTFEDVYLTGSDGRGLVVSGGGQVNLIDAVVSNNDGGGLEVLGGGFVDIQQDTNIFDNGLPGSQAGGGIRCTGQDSEVQTQGLLLRNRASSGGNMYISSGCYVLLKGGARIEGSNTGTIDNATSGGGVFVNNGGTLFVDGGQQQVSIKNNRAEFGGGLYVWGTGRATLLNVAFENNIATNKGAGIYAINGGTNFIQVLMGRVPACPSQISCSTLNGHQYNDSVVYVNNSYVRMGRTVMDSNSFISSQTPTRGVIKVENFGRLDATHLGITRNEAEYLIRVESGSAELTHITAARNSFQNNQGEFEDSFSVFNGDDVDLQNSIFMDTGGLFDLAGTMTADCNLTDNSSGWPAGTFSVGTAQFVNIGGGDARQVASSPGVDMCLADSHSWSSDFDIENQASPVNENTNPQGSPGQAGGLYDAGFDEVYDNIGDDEFLLTIQKQGSGQGTVISTPLGIACGSDCTEVYFRNTLVTLFANAAAGSEFAGWGACPLPSGNQCFITITESDTVFATFQPDDLIFSDGFN